LIQEKYQDEKGCDKHKRQRNNNNNNNNNNNGSMGMAEVVPL